MQNENTPSTTNNLRSMSVPLDHHDQNHQRRKNNESFNSDTSKDSFDLQIFARNARSSSFASPNMPKVHRKKFKSYSSNYGTLCTPFANLDDDLFDNRNKFSKNMASNQKEVVECESESDYLVDMEEDVTAGGGTLSPYDADGRHRTRRSVSLYDHSSSNNILRGDYQLRSSKSLGWSERNTPGTNHTRKLREMSTAFDQYVRTRRKVLFITCGMAAAFIFLCGMTSRMAAHSYRPNNNKTPASSSSSSDTTFNLSDKDRPTNTSSSFPSTSNNTIPDTTILASSYLSLCYTTGVISCFSSFLCVFFLSLRKRVTLSMIIMLIPLILLIFCETSNTISWTHYYSNFVMIFAGVGWGMFLPTVLSMLTPYGPNTKLWSTLGIPIGSLVVEILFVAEGMGMKSSQTTTHYGTKEVTVTAGISILFILIGLIVHLFAVPNVHVDDNGDSAYSVSSALGNVCLWMRGYLIIGCIAVFASSACVSMFSVGAISMALEKHTVVSLFGDSSQMVVPEGLVMTLYTSFSLIGSLMGRKMAYMVTRNDSSGCGAECILRLPFTFLFVTLLGGGIIAGAFKINWGVLLPLGVFLLGYGEGFVSNMMIRYVDEALPKEANLVGYVLLIGSCLGGCCLVWSFPIWVKMASWMGNN